MLYSVQVNIPAESGDMGVLANHVPSIEQLRPGIVEVIDESGGNKQYFRMHSLFRSRWHEKAYEKRNSGFVPVCAYGELER